MTQTAINRISYNNSEKAKIRDYILNHAGQGDAYLELYGNGESYSLAKKRGINVLSIDDGRQEDNAKRLKKEMKGRGRKFISLQDLCISKMKRRNDVIWLDYCGALSKDVRKDISVIPNIMADSGVIFFTFMAIRENFMPAGTDREIVNAIISAKLKKDLLDTGVQTRLFMHQEYLSPHKIGKYKRKTRMAVWGLKWTKIKP